MIFIGIFCCVSSFSQQSDYVARSAAVSSESSIGLSMMGWGLGLTSVIVATFLLINSSSAHAH